MLPEVSMMLKWHFLRQIDAHLLTFSAMFVCIMVSDESLANTIVRIW